MSDFLMPTYARQPIAFIKGEGPWLIDEAGKRYLDAISGIAVCGLGHAHTAISKAVCEQADTLIHTSNLYRVEIQEKLARRLCQLAGMDAAFFANSGAEANETAIKLARLYGHKRGVAEPEILVMEHSFHGRTLATLSATGNRKVQAGFEPLVRGFVRAPFGDLEAARRIASERPNMVAILVEPIQGEGGVKTPPSGYLAGLRSLCDELGWLLMVDEVQTGMGRAGRWFAHQLEGIRPDVMTLAKALGNGVPIGACLARGPAAGVFSPGNHGSTFGGNPLACRAALAVIETIEANGLVERAAALGQHMLEEFTHLLSDLPGVIDVRGTGLLLGIELDRPCGPLVDRAREQGLLINVTAQNVVRLLPPLILDDSQAHFLVEMVSELIKDFLQDNQES